MSFDNAIITTYEYNTPFDGRFKYLWKIEPNVGWIIPEGVSDELRRIREQIREQSQGEIHVEFPTSLRYLLIHFTDKRDYLLTKLSF